MRHRDTGKGLNKVAWPLYLFVLIPILCIFFLVSFVQQAAIGAQAKWGYIDQSGRMVIDPVFDNAGPLKDGKAMGEAEWEGGIYR